MRFNQRYQRQKGNILWALWAGILAYATCGQAWTSMDKHKLDVGYIGILGP